MFPKKYNPLFDPATDNLPIDPKVQAEVINDPKEDPQGISDQDEDFINMVLEKVNNGTIKLYIPSTLINTSVYETLTEEVKGKVDFNAVNLLSSLRQIKGLCDIGKRNTFQVENLINQFRMTKERLEKECGDVFII